MFQHLTKEAFGGSTISTSRDENVNYISTLINCPPQVMSLAADRDEEFVNVPGVAQSSPSAAVSVRT